MKPFAPQKAGLRAEKTICPRVILGSQGFIICWMLQRDDKASRMGQPAAFPSPFP